MKPLSLPLSVLCLLLSAPVGGAAAQDYSPGGFGPSGLEGYGLRHGDVTAATKGTTGVEAGVPRVGPAVPSIAGRPDIGAGPTGRITHHPQTVRRVQQALNKRGMGVEVDGIWGPQTQQALRTYQEQAGLTPDGLLDQQTIRALGAASPLIADPLD